MNDPNAAAQGQLDSEELMFLALQAMEQDRDDEAIQYLKRALVLEPKSGILHHLLGAVYAQLGMIDRAIDEMTQATVCNPQLHMARFQLGMLYFTSANLPEAETASEPLGTLPEDNPLRIFRSGLLHMARDEFPAAVADLKRGLELNTEHPSLNHDMQMLLEMSQQAIAESDAQAAGAAVPAPAPGVPPEGGRHILLSGYQGLADGKK